MYGLLDHVRGGFQPVEQPEHAGHKPWHKAVGEEDQGLALQVFGTEFPTRGHTDTVTDQTSTTAGTVTGLLSDIAAMGTDPLRGGYTRPVYSTAELELRAWFIDQATKRGLTVETDRNGAIWAWWDIPGGDRSNSLITGSHLDSVPGGGPVDGPLGVASALVAVDILKSCIATPAGRWPSSSFPKRRAPASGSPALAPG